MNLDLIPNGAIRRVHVSQNDIGRTLTFELFNNSTSYTVPSGAVVKIQGTKPSGFGFSETCTVNGNVATIDTTEAMTDESGNIQTELSISYDDVVIGTSNFVLAVEKNPHPDTTTDGSMETIIPELTLLVNEVKGYAEEIEGTYHVYGSPWVASTVAQMTDTDKIYVYVGSESGYTNGNWYYYNGTAWVSGGVYNSVAVQTDTTLSVSGMPADAKVVGDKINDIKQDLNEICVEVKSNNLFNINSDDTLVGKYRNATNTIVDNAIFMCTNLIDVSDISTVYCKQFDYGTDVTFLQVLKYDADGNFIERSAINSSISGTHNYTVGTEKYVRFNVQYPNGADVANVAKTFMLAKYNITYFEEYFDPYLTVDSVAISRIDSTHFQINFGSASVILFYTNNTSTGNANWNIGTLKIGNAVLVPAGTDILGPVKINDDTDFIGGVHGDETTTCIYISIGGKTLIPSKIENPIVSDTMTITMASEVYEQGTTTKAFDRVVQIVFRKGRMLVSNTFTASESLTLKRATNGGLLASYSDDIIGIAFNNSYYSSVPTTSVSNSAGTNTMATIHTKYGSATVRNIIGNASSNYTGYLQVFTSETPQRCKIYFDTYKQGSYSLNAYGKVTGTFEYIFA